MELLVTASVLVVVGMLSTTIFENGLRSLTDSQMRIVATGIANEQMEILRNMPYDSLGTTTGWPHGSVQSSSTLQRNGQSFTVQVRIDYIDDPFDGNAAGTIVGKPRDDNPTDYKRADVTVTWVRRFATPVTLSSYVVPNGVEAPANTGSLSLHVYDSTGGTAVPQATVTVTSSALANPIVNTVDNFGNLQILGLPPASNAYHIVVTKAGYSTDQTYDPTTYPSADHPDLTIAVSQVTDWTFYIDKTSTLTVTTQDNACSVIGAIPLSLVGQKTIAPGIPKFTLASPTNASGILAIPNLEWDDYTLMQTSPSYDVAGVIPPAFLHILPNTTQSTALVLEPHTAHSLLVTVKDANTGTTITGATVRLSNGLYDVSKVTGVGTWTQSDWSGGSGQQAYSDPTKYATDDSHSDGTSTPGVISLKSSITTIPVGDAFSDTVQEDGAATTAEWDTGSGTLHLPYASLQYAVSGIGQSKKLNTVDGRITAATLSANDSANGQSIVYELSANGGSSFEQVLPGVPHTFAAPGSDLRFRITLSTNDQTVTPSVDSVNITATVLQYDTSAVLTSSTLDTNTASVNYQALTWGATPAGTDSVRLQVAANNDNATWDFVGPSGTAADYYTVSGADIAGVLDGKRYVRYRLYLQTADLGTTPTVSSVSISYVSGCLPPGQSFFAGLSAAAYTLDVSAPGYASSSTPVTISGTMASTIKLTPS